VISQLTPNQRSALERAIKHPELQLVLFRKTSSLVWFDAFKEAGLLSGELIPPPKEVEEGQFQIPSWPVTEYLVSSSMSFEHDQNLEYADKFWVVIKEATLFAKKNGFGNYRVWWQFAKIIRNLPLEVILNDFLVIVGYWLSDKFDRGLVGDQVVGWLVELLGSSNDQSLEVAISLLDFVYHIDFVDRQFSSEGKKEAKLTFQSHQIGSGELIANKAGEVLGQVAVDFFREKMEVILEVEGSDKLSSLWRSAIQDHQQNHRLEGADNIVLEALRDSLIGYLSVSEPRIVNETIVQLLSNRFETIRRVAIFAASVYFDRLSDITVGNVLTPQYFQDNYRHEIWHLINKHFSGVDGVRKNAVLQIIQDSTICLNDDGGIEERSTAYQRLLWLSAIKDQDENALEFYKKCIAITGTEPDHPDFASFSTSGWVTHESPITLEDLRGMSSNPGEMVVFLNNYDHQGFFNEPGLEGLVKVFGVLVAHETPTIVDNLDSFLTLRPHYLHELFSSFSNLWDEKDEKAEFDWTNVWPKLLAFAQTLLSGDQFWEYPEEAPGGAFIGNSDWVIGTLSRFIEAGCKKDSHSFGLINIPVAKSVLETILLRQRGELFKEDSDAVSIAINSPRGRCLEAYINLALYHCRNTEEDERPIIAGEYVRVFELELHKADEEHAEFEFATLVAKFLPNFLYLSKDWTLGNIHKIFDRDNHLRWLCAVQGYSYVQFIPEVYEHLKVNGDIAAILDNEELRKRVDDRYIQFISIAYYRKIESLDDEKSLIFILHTTFVAGGSMVPFWSEYLIS